MSSQPLKFTQPAQFAFNKAIEFSAAYNQAVLKPEHLLLGLLVTPSCAAAAILRALNVDARLLGEKIEGRLGPRPALGSAQKFMFFDQGAQVSPEVDAILGNAAAEAQRTGLAVVDTRLVLLNLLRQSGSLAAQLLREQNVTVLTAHAVNNWPNESAPAGLLPPPTWRELPLTLSPIFILLVAVTLIAGFIAYRGGEMVRVAVFLFVTGGWLVSLSLHEFGHALVAFFGGDRSVADKGYLTLNPLKYTHKWLSIVMPILFMAMGGIGLPGGAVYINRSAIRNKWVLSLVSAAGPVATGLCAMILTVPFSLRLAGGTRHPEFWAGLALLAFLQLSALFFNLLPIPGLDGFGIFEPFLPAGVLNIVYRFRNFTFLIIFFIFIYDTPVSKLFWLMLGIVIWIAGIDPELIETGLSLYRFWMG